ncbi:MAG: MptD family putative ECF transporter S component [Ruminococcus sp.]
MKEKIFEPFKVKDIVFLSIISAITLCTCAVMPLVGSLQTVVFGIAQVVTSLQISIFFAIGLMKIRKTGSLFIMSLLTGLFQLMMAPPMFFSNIVIGLLLEILVALIFKGFKKDSAVFFAATLYNPLSLPFNYLYNLLFGREAMAEVATKAPWITVGMTLAVIALSALGAFIGIKISKELKKSGAMKK